jgi:hypothetical protein
MFHRRDDASHLAFTARTCFLIFNRLGLVHELKSSFGFHLVLRFSVKSLFFQSSEGSDVLHLAGRGVEDLEDLLDILLIYFLLFHI